jgi:hypothetical protein
MRTPRARKEALCGRPRAQHTNTGNRKSADQGDSARPPDESIGDNLMLDRAVIECAVALHVIELEAFHSQEALKRAELILDHSLYLTGRHINVPQAKSREVWIRRMRADSQPASLR